MDRAKNPFSPGPGLEPPLLAGRTNLLVDIDVILQRLALGFSPSHTFLYGLRGVGKTVLLIEAENMALQKNYLAERFEVDEIGEFNFREAIFNRLKSVLLKLDNLENLKSKFRSALNILKSISINYAGIDFKVDVEEALGEADSKNFADDLLLMMVQVGKVAKAVGKPVCILIDEIQNLEKADLAALLGAIHRLAQEKLPILVICAGLPNVLTLASEAKSYAERFDYFPVGKLKYADAFNALTEPFKNEQVNFTTEAADQVIDITKGYPFFIQVFGKYIWDLAQTKTIDLATVNEAIPLALDKLDASFFEIRFNRCTEQEKKFLFCMAQNSEEGPIEIKLIIDCLQKTSQNAGQLRNRLIEKGIIYSTHHGKLDFTVPLFGDYIMKRTGKI